MSIYNEFNELYPYIQSIRKLKTYLSFDMSFPKDWKLPKKYVPQDSVIENKSTDPTMRLISFGVEFNEDTVNTIVDSIKNLIKYNREIEEKERLFSLKVQELKTIFEKQNLIALQDLKFDLESNKLKLEDEYDTVENREGEEHRVVEE